MMEALFQDLSQKISFPIDQVRYLFLFLCSFPLAYIFKTFLSPNNVSLSVRHIVSTSLGISFTCICFKPWEVILLLGFVGVCYLIISITPPKTCQWYTMIFAFGSIVIAHCYRMFSDYEGWHQDFTGPLMILVQRVTSVSCALHDGLGRNDGDLNKDQREQRIRQRPTILEYSSYCLNFISVLAGPMYTYKDYIRYITGDNLKPLDNPNQYAKAKEHSHAPSPLGPVLTKLSTSLVFISFTFALSDFTPESALDPSLTLPIRIVYVSLATFRVRCLYYFVFIITDAICNTAGLGFNGYNKEGVAQWNLVTNVDPISLEFGINMRAQVQAWNIGTTLWLKRCVYERMSFYPTVMTWIVSAAWHGLYPGYHMSFLVFALANLTSRKVRKVFWKKFQRPQGVKICYDIVTGSATSLGRDFGALPFILLSYEKTITLWSSYYFIPLLICIGLFVFLPDDNNAKSSSTATDTFNKQNGVNHVIKNN